MRPWRGPNRRNTKTAQVEWCDLCGRAVGAADRVQVFVEGLAGLWVCADHGEFINNPSFNDYGGTGSASQISEPTEPHSGTNWSHEEDW